MFRIMLSLYDNKNIVIQELEPKLLCNSIYHYARFAYSKQRVKFQSALILHPCVESPRYGKVQPTNDVIRVSSKDTPTFYPRKGLYDAVDAYRRCITHG